MESKQTKAVSLILLAALMVFNVGVPVYLYLCPLMDSDNPMCAMSPAEANGLSLTSITPDCCAKYLVAERNTTPYVKTNIHQVEVERLQIAEAVFVTPLLPDPPAVVAIHDGGIPSSSPPPLYVLHGTFLL